MPIVILILILIFFLLSKSKEGFTYVFPMYNEDLKWVPKDAIVYNKGNNFIPLPNIGRDAHTILYHIINNYDNLDEITIFGSNGEHRQDKVNKTIELVNKTNNTVFICEGNIEYNFTLNYWSATNPDNKNSNAILNPHSIRPFGKWYNSVWPNSPVTWICYMCIFAVHRNHIIQHPKSYYEFLIKDFKTDSDEYVHYMERAFSTVFWPYPMNCVYR